jgi:hypothetical protein
MGDDEQERLDWDTELGRVERADAGAMVILDKPERKLLLDLIDSMLELLDSGGRDDPAMERLFPDAYDSEPEARAWHDLVGDELQRQKTSSLTSVKDALKRGKIELNEEQMQMWLSALNDVRLAIGARLEVTEEMMGAELALDDPRAPTLAVVHWLGWLQESMLQAMPSGR